MNTVILPWPSKGLSPNDRMHWRKKGKVTKKYRRDCRMSCLEAKLVAPDGPLLLVLEFVPPTRRNRDDDNLIASFKAGRDGIADALRVDDSRFKTEVIFSDEIAEGGLVRVQVRVAV